MVVNKCKDNPISVGGKHVYFHKRRVLFQLYFVLFFFFIIIFSFHCFTLSRFNCLCIESRRKDWTYILCVCVYVFLGGLDSFSNLNCVSVGAPTDSQLTQHEQLVRWYGSREEQVFLLLHLNYGLNWQRWRGNKVNILQIHASVSPFSSHFQLMNWIFSSKMLWFDAFRVTCIYFLRVRQFEWQAS